MPDSNITVYRPNMRHEQGFFRTWLVMSGNVWRSRELIWQLFKRDFLAVYKKSFLGLAWLFASPVIGIVSWVFLQKTGMLRPGDVDVPYPAYILVGTSMWGLFVGMCTGTSQTLTVGQSLIMQVNYPHEALLFKQAAQQLADFVVGFGLILLVLLGFKVWPAWNTLLLPFVALPLILLSSAIGLVISMFAVVVVDVSRGLPIVLGVLMYTMPVIYSPSMENPLVQTLNRWNPLTYLVCSCRDIVIYGRLYHPAGYFIAAGVSFVIFVLAWRLFYVSEEKLVERMV